MDFKGYKIAIVRGTPRYMKVGERGFKNPKDVPQEVIDHFTSAVPVLLEEPASEHRGNTADLAPRETEATDAEIMEAYKQIEENQKAAPTFTELELELIDQLEQAKAAETAQLAPNLEEIGKFLYEKFGVYTLWAGVDPQVGDTHPFTATQMSRYEVGVAYQARRRAVSSGSIDNDIEAQKAHNDAGKEAQVRHAEEIESRADPDFTEPKQRSFIERTSVEGQKYSQSSTTLKRRENDPISEEPTQEPNLNGQTIRPYW